MGARLGTLRSPLRRPKAVRDERQAASPQVGQGALRRHRGMRALQAPANTVHVRPPKRQLDGDDSLLGSRDLGMGRPEAEASQRAAGCPGTTLRGWGLLRGVARAGECQGRWPMSTRQPNRNPFAGTVTRDGKLVVGEVCSCAHLRTVHRDVGSSAGRGACEQCGCPIYCLQRFLFEGDDDTPTRHATRSGRRIGP